jgi:hypothetical protein
MSMCDDFDDSDDMEVRYYFDERFVSIIDLLELVLMDVPYSK